MIKIDLELFKKHYLKENLTISECASIFNCGRTTVNRFRKKNNIRKPQHLINKKNSEVSFKYNIEDLKEHAENKGGKCLSNIYITSKNKYLWEDSSGNQWEAVWSKIKAGSWSPFESKLKKHALKYKMEDLHEYAENKGGKCLSNTYGAGDDKYLWEDSEGNKWEAEWYTIKKGSWSPFEWHLRLINDNPNKDCMEDLHEYAKSKGGKCLSYLYMNSHTEYLWEDSSGNQWNAGWYRIKAGSWSPFEANIVSKQECEISKYVESLSFVVKNSDRKQIKPKELDIYIPSKNLAIEYNGLYWHSDIFKNRNYHYDKYKLCKEKNIKLLGIYADEWKNKTDLVKSMIKHRLGILPDIKLRASKLKIVKLIKNKEFAGFFDKFHLDGHSQSSFAYGLYHNDELVSCASFRKNGRNKCWEIARFASNYNFHIYGSLGKILKNYKKEYNEKLISFSNNRLSHGNIYKMLGFKEITSKSNKPSYWYTDLNNKVFRTKCMKNNDLDIVKKYPTEKEQALAGIFSPKNFNHNKPLYKIYDYGHRKWEL